MLNFPDLRLHFLPLELALIHGTQANEDPEKRVQILERTLRREPVEVMLIEDNSTRQQPEDIYDPVAGESEAHVVAALLATKAVLVEVEPVFGRRCVGRSWVGVRAHQFVERFGGNARDLRQLADSLGERHCTSHCAGTALSGKNRFISFAHSLATYLSTSAAGPFV